MPALVGRDRETAIVDTFLRELRGGPAGLVVEGAAGTGKTRLWEEALARAALHSVRLLQARPAPFETQIAYSGLFDLLRDTADDVLRILPRPQRRALAAALLLEEGEGHAAEPRAVAVAFATGVRALACDGPVLVAVDDEPLLDQPSADALRYTTRRLRDETVGLLATRRASGEPPLPLELAALGDRRVRRLVLEPLPFAAVHELLRAHLGVALPAPVVRRIHQRSGGNPFFALELGRALQRRGGPAADEPLPASLSGLVQERVAALSADARRLLYLAAVQREPSLGSLDQPDIVPEPRPALDEALRAGVVDLAGDQIRFAHPLLAEAVVAQAGLAERIALHRRLAERAPTAEERARHIALGGHGPSTGLARAVHEGATEARSRGAPSACAELLQHALRLTPDDDPARAGRELELGEALFAAGDPVAAREVLERLADRLDPGGLRAAALWQLAVVAGEIEGSEVELRLYAAALPEAEGNPMLSSRLEVGLARMALFRGKLAEAEEHAGRAVALAEEHPEAEVLAGALGTHMLVERYAGRDVPADLVARALELERLAPRLGAMADPPTSSYSLQLRGQLLVDQARAVLEQWLERVVADGDESSEPMVLFRLVDTELLAGRWERAAEHAASMRAIAEATQLFVEYTRLATGLVDAHQGRLAAARKAAVDGVDFAVRVGEPVLAHQNRALLGFVELSDGNVTEAADELERWEAVARGLGYRDPFHLLRGALNEAEALVAADRLDRAAAVLDWFEAAGAATGRAWPAVLARRVRGLLFAARGELDDALDCVASLGDNPSLAGLPFERGRALLAAGTIRRRLKHRREAREDLQQAHATFEALGAGPWARRAEIELRRIGGRTATVRELTATEQRIANLVATGRTNREVAAEAFVSVKTVEGTLTRIYAKLGVRSRTELARALSRRTGSG